MKRSFFSGREEGRERERKRDKERERERKKRGDFAKEKKTTETSLLS